MSTATISRAINEPHKVAKATLDCIETVIARLGYTPNFGGKVLASNRSNVVGAIIPTMTNSMFASGLQAFQEVLSTSGVNLLVASSGYNFEDELKQIRSLVGHGADGLLLIGSSRLKDTAEFLALRKIPHVISWCYQPDQDRVYSGFDNAKAAKNMCHEILKLGHRHIAMIAGQTLGNDRAQNRIIGVRSAIDSFGQGACLTQIIESRYSLDHGGDAFERIMTSRNPPTAIICGNDVLAAGAVIRANRMSINVPAQVSVTGFDDISLASAVSPALTTVRVPQEAMGRTAATLLLKLLSNDQSVRSEEFETKIIMRESLSKPHSGPHSG